MQGIRAPTHKCTAHGRISARLQAMHNTGTVTITVTVMHTSRNNAEPGTTRGQNSLSIKLCLNCVAVFVNARIHK